MKKKAALVTSAPALGSVSGSALLSFGLASTLVSAGFEVEVLPTWFSVGTGELGESEAWRTIDCTADTFEDARRLMAERLALTKPDVVWVFGGESWAIFEPVARDYPHVFLVGQPTFRAVRARGGTWQRRSESLQQRLMSWQRRTRASRTPRDEERRMVREANRLGVVASFSPAEIGVYEKWLSESVDFCEIALPDPGARKVPGGDPFLLLGGLMTLQTRAGIDYFTRKVWPHWRTSSLPQSTVVRVVGSGDLPPTIRVPDEVGISLIGFVRDLDQEWSVARALLVPGKEVLGVRTKIIEAWSKGVPVIADPAAMSGLPEMEPEINCLVPRDPAGWVEAAERILNDDRLTQSLAQGGREAFLANHFSGTSAAGYEAISRRAMNRWDDRGHRAAAEL